MKDWKRDEVIRAVEERRRRELALRRDEDQPRDWGASPDAWREHKAETDALGAAIEARVAAITPRQAKRIERRIETANEIEFVDANDARALNFTARLLTQVSLPHSKREGNEYSRRNGRFQMNVLAPSAVGLPYGHYPRLLLTWITTEAVRTKSRTLELGDSLSAFMSELGLTPTGGRWGSIPRLHDHMKRLFSSTISWTYEDGQQWQDRGVRPVEKSSLWWDPKRPEQAALWRSMIQLSSTFYDEIVEHPVPVDMRVLKCLAHEKSSLAIDIYTWLTHRMSYLWNPTAVPWSALHRQFGGDYSRPRKFKEKFIERLKLVTMLYPEARVSVEDFGLKLTPSPTHIPARGN